MSSGKQNKVVFPVFIGMYLSHHLAEASHYGKPYKSMQFPLDKIYSESKISFGSTDLKFGFSPFWGYFSCHHD